MIDTTPGVTMLFQVIDFFFILFKSRGDDLNGGTALLLTKDQQVSLITSWSGRLQQSDGKIGINDVFAKQNGIENDSQVKNFDFSAVLLTS